MKGGGESNHTARTPSPGACVTACSRTVSPVGERSVDYRWWIVTEDDLRAETAEFGLSVRPVGPTVANLYSLTIENDNQTH